MPLPASLKSTGAELVQRFFDAMLSGIGLIILSPLLISLAAWIVLDSRGPVFYRAKRVGRYGASFELYKFRSMVVDADRLGPGITVAQDRRVTRAGRFMRRTKLDELPQLINVLNGDMSLVGPRPEDPRYVALYNDQQRQIFNVRPGITSAASLAYRHEEDLLTGVDWEAQYVTQIMPAKLEIDLEYERNRTLWSDIRLILRTVGAMAD